MLTPDINTEKDNYNANERIKNYFVPCMASCTGSGFKEVHYDAVPKQPLDAECSIFMDPNENIFS